MTTQDYKKIALVFAEYRLSPELIEGFEPLRLQEAIRSGFAQRMADMLAAENPRFDRTAFLVACGVMD